MEIIGKWKLTDEVSVQGSDDSLFQSELAIHSIFKPAFGSNAEVEIILSCEINEESEALSVQVLVSHSLVATEAYNLGCFNHQVEDNKVTVTTLQNVKEPFRRFSLLRLGPDPQESCCEYFILEKQDFLRIAVAAATVDGIVHTISRVFKRVVGYPVANHKLEQVNKTYGWDVLKYWPVNAIELCELKVTRVLGVQTVPEPQQTTLWSLDQSIDEIKKNTYSSEPYADPANQLYFSIQVCYITIFSKRCIFFLKSRYD